MPRIHHRHRKRLLERDHKQCFICKKKYSLDIHHIVPQSKGGSSDDENCITLCKFCHTHISKDIQRIMIMRFQGLGVNTFEAYWKRYDELKKQSPSRTVPKKAYPRGDVTIEE